MNNFYSYLFGLFTLLYFSLYTGASFAQVQPSDDRHEDSIVPQVRTETKVATVIRKNQDLILGAPTTSEVPFVVDAPAAGVGKNKALWVDDYRSGIQVRYDFMRAEQKEINAVLFIAREDATGLAFYHELRAAARRGVKVKVIFDDYGATGASSSKKLTHAMVRHLMDEGVEVKIYNKIDNRALLDPQRYMSRMHEKILLFKGEESFIMGDRNLSNKYFGISKNKDKFLSRDLLVSGDETKVVAHHFDRTFHSDYVEVLDFNKSKIPVTDADVLACKQKLDATASSMEAHPIIKKGITAQNWKDKAKSVKKLTFFGDSPTKTNNVAHQKLLDLITNAKKNVVIESPYVILNKQNSAAIQQAQKNGSAVEVITNNGTLTDEVWVPPAADDDLRKLQKQGVNVFESSAENTRILHTKSYLIDDKYIFFGSNNFDNRSQNWDRESGVIIEDEAFSQDLKKMLARDKTMATKLDLNRPRYRAGGCKHMMYWMLSNMLRPIL